MSTGMIGTTIAVFESSSPNVTTSREHRSAAETAPEVPVEVTEIAQDDVDGPACNGTESRKVRAECDRLEDKIDRTKQLIQRELTANEKNVREYLALTSGASSSPTITSAGAAPSRIKTDFERKNQKSAHTISHLQRKLDEYNRRLKEAQSSGRGGLTSRGSSASWGQGHRPAKRVLKDVRHGFKELFIRDTRSREASPCYNSYSVEAKQIKDTSRRNKAGSLDNILSTSKAVQHVLGHTCDSKSADGKDYNSGVKDLSDEEISRSSILTDSASGDNHVSPHRYVSHRPTTGPPSQPCPGSSGLEGEEQILTGAGCQSDDVLMLLEELRDNHDIQQRLQATFESLKTQYDSESASFRQTLDEERERCDRLEEQLNDLGELHQNEVTNIKQELSSMQEKMEYQLDERTKDMQELLESCQTKISKIEMQQQHQQQLISMEDIENSNFRTVLTKLLNVLLAILAVILVLVSTIANLLGPFLTNRVRIVMTICLIACLVAVWDNWPVLCDTIDRLIISRYREINVKTA